MNINNKKSITIDNKCYVISSELKENMWKIMLTNLNDLFIEKLSRDEIIDRCERLNPLLNIEDIDVISIINVMLDDIPKYFIETSSLNEIKLQTIIDDGTFKFIINLNRANNEEYNDEIIHPITSYVIELQQKFNDLIDEIKKKDEEIEEYKASGAKLIRKHIETIPFNINLWITDTFREYQDFLTMCQLNNDGDKIKNSSDNSIKYKKIKLSDCNL